MATVKQEGNNNSRIEGGELNTKMSGRRVWLVKVPTFLAEAWLKPENQNQELGNVNIREEKGKAEMSITLKGDYAAQIPKQYNLTYSVADTYTQIFSQADSGGMALEGNVEYRCDVRPVITEEYHSLMKGRVTKATTKNRYLQSIDSSEVLTNNPHGRDYDTKRRKVSEKRERMERDELINALCNLFERQTYWDFNSLARSTDQPQNWLKEVLNDICIYNKRGPHKGEYCLKAEYRTGNSGEAEKELV